MADDKAKTYAVRGRPCRRLRQLLGWVAAAVMLYYCFFLLGQGGGDANRPAGDAAPGTSPIRGLRESLSLTDQQCRRAFPGLMKPIDDIVAEGPFDVEDRGELGPLQGRSKDSKVRSARQNHGVTGRVRIADDDKLYIISTQRKRDLSPQMVNVRNPF